MLEGLENGADAYITKPFSINVLRANIRKILANRVLSGVKAICRLEKEKRGEAYLKSHREYLASRMIMEALDMLAQAAWKQEEDFLDVQGMSGELSKEAKKELFLRNQDKGYEH